MFHPRPAHWFDLMVPRDDLGQAMETLARLGAVELEATQAAAANTEDDWDAVTGGLEAYGAQARRYGAYWPEADRTAPFPASEPARVAKQARADLDAWAADARETVQDLQAAEARGADLMHLKYLALGAGEAFPVSILTRFAPTPGVLDARIYLLAETDHATPRGVTVRDGLYAQTIETPGGEYLLVVGERSPMDDLDAELSAQKARRVHLPQNLITDATDKAPPLLTALETRLADEIRAQEQARFQLGELGKRHGVAQARANLDRLGWLAEHAGATGHTRHFARITGWCARAQSDIEAALSAHDVDHVLAFPAPPRDKTPPMQLDNPAWARPFEAFVRLLGMPGQGEADPSPIVAIMAPLLFGYMFGDVGQGLVLLIAGLTLRKRVPAAAILVPGGIFAMLFGLAFGSIFAVEHVIPALWLHPLQTPIPVLAVALGLGVAILLTGLALQGISAAWRGEGGKWLAASAGLVVAYVGVLAAFADVRALALTGIGAAWFVAGSALIQTQARGAAVGHAIGEMVETLFQLLINTLSFVRVGAFAIAHAGLSSAIVVLATIAGDGIGFWAVLIIGNVFIIALEGLVAGIQTTRLVLFEFFIRFLRAEGRALKPLPTPEAWAMQFLGRTS